MAEEYPIILICHVFFTHSSVHRHLSYFPFMAIVNNVTMNIYLHVFVWTYAFTLLGIYLGMELWGI